MPHFIIFVEDKALKRVIQTFLKKHNITLPVKIPTESGGWNTVLKNVEELNKLEVNAIGILDGDVVNVALKIAEEKGIKDKIFVTDKREIERYFYDKEKIHSSIPEKVKNLSFDEFKKWLNHNEHDFNKLSKILIEQECEELKKLEKFIFK